MARLAKVVLALLSLAVLAALAVSAVEVSVCNWHDHGDESHCELTGAAYPALVGARGAFTGFEELGAKVGAFEALCVGTAEADCPSDTCAWNATTSTCSATLYSEADATAAILDCPGTKGGDYLSCAVQSYYASFAGTAPQCNGACGDFNYTDPSGQVMAVCVPASDLSLPVETITEWFTSALNVLTGSNAKYEPDRFGCCPAYILWQLGTSVGCGAARTKAACSKRGLYSTFCEWEAATGGGGSCIPSEASTFVYGRRPKISNALKSCAAFKTSTACANQKIVLPDHATLLKYARMPNSQPRQCPVNFWDAVKAWGRPR